MEIVLVPVCPNAGVTVRYQVLNATPKKMLFVGTRFVSLDSPRKTRLSSAVSTSATVR